MIFYNMLSFTMIFYIVLYYILEDSMLYWTILYEMKMFYTTLYYALVVQARPEGLDLINQCLRPAGRSLVCLTSSCMLLVFSREYVKRI